MLIIEKKILIENFSDLKRFPVLQVSIFKGIVNTKDIAYCLCKLNQLKVFTVFTVLNNLFKIFRYNKINRKRYDQVLEFVKRKSQKIWQHWR